MILKTNESLIDLLLTLLSYGCYFTLLHRILFLAFSIDVEFRLYRLN